MKIIQVYAPTSSSTDEAIEEFYEELTEQVTTSKDHYTLVMGDVIANIGIK